MATAKKADPATKSKGGRPPTPNMDVIKQLICEEISTGKSLAKVLESPGMPGFSTVMTWLREDVTFQKDYANAREARAEVLFDEMDEVAEQAVASVSAVEVAGLRLKMDTIKWKLARMNSKKYGEKVSTEVTGANGGPVQHSLAVRFVAP